MKTKFGEFYGNQIQFPLFDNTTNPPAMVVCVYPNSSFLFKTKQEANNYLNYLKFDVINKLLTKDIETLKEERREINMKIAQLKSEMYTV
jgi:dsDNA-binding SOS-regulon protein